MHLVIWSAIATDHLKMSVNWVRSSESMTKISQTAKLFVGSHVDPHSYIHTWLVLGLPTQESEGLGHRATTQWSRRWPWATSSSETVWHGHSSHENSNATRTVAENTPTTPGITCTGTPDIINWPQTYDVPPDFPFEQGRIPPGILKHQDRFNGITCLPNGYFTPLPLQAIRTDPFALRMTHWGWPSPTNGKCHVWLLTGQKKTWMSCIVTIHHIDVHIHLTSKSNAQPIQKDRSTYIVNMRLMQSTHKRCCVLSSNMLVALPTI